MAGASPTAELAIQRANSGEKLPTQDRRIAVAYLISGFATEPMTNIDMARLFDVDEKTIRNDIKIIKTERAEDVKESTDVKIIINDLLQARDRALLRINRGLKALEVSKKMGTTTELAFIKAELDIHLKVTEALQNMGWLPKNIGQVTVNKKVWKAIVEHKTGGIKEVRPLDLFDDMRDGETLEDTLRRKSLQQAEEIQDAEFVTLPQLLPVALVDNGSEKENNSSSTEESSRSEGVSESVSAPSDSGARRAAET